MSKTWFRNKKRDFLNNIEDSYRLEDDCPGLSGLNRRKNWHLNISQCAKHSRRKKVLQREFTKYGLNPLDKDWKNIVGEAHEQSSRLHSLKRDMAHKRRHRMKVEAKRIIDNSLGL